MTDEQFDAELDRRDKISPHMAAMFAVREASRARDSEVAKNATIKALADALWDARAYGDTEKTACWCTIPSAASFCRRVERNTACIAKVAALRLAGRLP
jgi:hypothetical protein